MALPGRPTRVIWLTAAIVLMSCGLGWAQPAGGDAAFERMRAKIKAGDRLTVDLQNGSRLDGRVVDAGPDWLSISTPIGDRKLTPPEVVVVRRHGHGVILGAIIGGGVGLACGAALGTLLYNEGHDRDPVVFGLTAIGLGAGIGIDALANIPRIVYQRSPSRSALKVDVGPRRASVRVLVTF